MFEDKVTDILGLYLDPPERAVVLCVDEKSQIQALDRTQPGLPLKKGRAATSCWKHAFVADQNLGVAGKSARDGHLLREPTRQLAGHRRKVALGQMNRGRKAIAGR